ncbi:universal stress protein [Halodesulfurarchaeum sp.]|uniref:universal stress protein n=1 Tax=Halodesulfurarchaeum sp. TaxID=1980530 RepID=UPI001BBB23CE|nr:universal stress protein [Halodesulfurarchaeum sp.]
MSERGPEGDVLVAVAEPEHVPQLVRTAADLARQRTGRVRLMTVEVKSRDSPFGMFSDETIIEEFAADSHELLDQAPKPEGVEIVRDLVVARTVAKGVVSAVKRTDPTALVIGWDSEPSRSDALLGTTVDAVFERAPTDVYAERIGREAGGVGSVLVPVAGGPHVRAAVTAGGAIATENQAQLTVFSVGRAETDRESAQSFVEEGVETFEGVLGDSMDVETHVEMADSIEDAIVDAAEAHDVVVFGATRKGVLRGRLVGSVPRHVVNRTDKTVLIARGEHGTIGVLGRLQAMLSGKK